ncbi:hypothetical protein CP863_00745 [Cutibacterium acnes]|uniref:Uncharacterized protein n=1 Tax=Cutibacterium acnes TaxID=1747 RepID=A0AAD0QRZ5_CUTAC|nr:hypothetical protein DXN06_05665 [Cutibacterium acnes]PGF31954.1 hypothetical protein B1B10_11060 [Cutibacterium acnes subsp. acnes]PGF33390.1 hypothetical protein B1B11_10460 [Cutibacterium acnes subsp. acnes]REB33710.1 hypothetical protein CP863_00745 [Cutibacterium acnes]REB37853.1 hypothetical protein CP861_00745 [Cutibacterium acnes]
MLRRPTPHRHDGLVMFAVWKRHTTTHTSNFAVSVAVWVTVFGVSSVHRGGRFPWQTTGPSRGRPCFTLGVHSCSCLPH